MLSLSLTLLCATLGPAWAGDPSSPRVATDGAATTPVDAPDAGRPGVLERELERLRDLVRRLRASRPDVFGPGDALGARRPLARGPDGRPLDDLAELLAREVLLLERTTTRLEQAPPDAESLRLQSFRHDRVAEDEVLALPAGGAPRLAWIEIANAGRAPLVAPRVSDGRPARDDLASLARAAAGDATIPEETARALWAFLVREREHGAPPGELGEVHDPVKLLSVYGYGLCDDAANAFVHLARALGLEARVWALGGHVVPEALVDGRWQMYDVDHEVLYRTPDGRVAGVEELQRQPDWLQRRERLADRAARGVDAAHVREVFASAADNRVVEYPAPERFHALRWQLRQGERVVLRAGSRGLRAAATRFDPPGPLADGDWIHDLVLDAAGPATLAYELPWPILGGTLWLAPPPGAAAALPDVALVVDGRPLPAAPTAIADGQVALDLDALLVSGSETPPYACELRLDVPAAWVGTGARLELRFQHAPGALPVLHPGANVLRFSADSGAALVTIAWTP